MLTALSMLVLSHSASAASLSPDLQDKLTALGAEETIQVMLTFIGGRPKTDTLQELSSITPQLYKMQGGRVIGAVATGTQIDDISKVRTVRTIELAR